MLKKIFILSLFIIFTGLLSSCNYTKEKKKDNSSSGLIKVIKNKESNLQNKENKGIEKEVIKELDNNTNNKDNEKIIENDIIPSTGKEINPEIVKKNLNNLTEEQKKSGNFKILKKGEKVQNIGGKDLKIKEIKDATESNQGGGSIKGGTVSGANPLGL